ncbi:hypothetical protein [Roseobacter sp. N2S]|uniref:hypothetical protein n=1 Tax=Roseobacter sp. N2S TaxID=2663844 RepID=UPI002855A608|nr:hypothetical protein [Roseobacter sp. N2S]MDR6265898.1 transposase-like protein [Roseobacter sp. N2S]
MAENEIWGFAIRKAPSGRNIWPNDLKREVTRRIREEGESPGDVAAAIGAHECLVRKWWVADRRQRGEKVTVEGPAFAELNVERDIPAPKVSAPASSHNDMGRIHCGTMFIEFPLGISESDLIKLVRAAEGLQ